nr:GAF domain-containing protein [Spirochaetota bacterium]
MKTNELCVDLSDLLKIAEELNHNKDLDSLLDNILREARKSTGADAGSIFIAEKNMLKFSYVQNDTISKREHNKNKYIYSELTVPIDTNSIAGYVAVTGKNVTIPDAYKADSSLPFTLNKSFDEKSNYKTISILAVPLVTSQNKTVGVMQLINSMDPEGNIRPFTETHEKFANFIAANASVAVERALMTRQNILRMVKMSELRDPKETGNHVNRVGSYCVEIYDAWSRKNGIDSSERRRFKDILKIGAMLHDVGKVAISDKILKKPSKLDDEEYKIMKRHSKYGADLFDPDISDLDAMCHDIARHHHEKWNGTG